MYKHLTRSDITTRPFKTYKNWTIQSLDSAGVDTFGEETYVAGRMSINEGLKIDGVFYESSSVYYTSSQDPVNASGEYKRITYSQAQSMFYSGDDNPLMQFGVETLGKDPETGVGEVRTLGDRILVAKIDRDYWGEKIKPLSVHLTDYSNPHTIYDIYDDGFSNLYITSSHFSSYQQLRAIKAVESKSYYLIEKGEFYFEGTRVTFDEARGLMGAGGKIDYVEAADSWVYPPYSPPQNIYDARTERFGSSVSAWYKYIGVGAPQDTQSFSTGLRGQVDLFKYDDAMQAHRFVRYFRSSNYPDTGSATASIAATAQGVISASMLDSFGYSVSINDDYMAIGAPTEDPNVTGSLAQGMVYLYYKYKGGADHWGQVGTLIGSGSGYRFGEAVSLSGDVLAIGSPGENNNSGSVYIFRNASLPSTGSFVWNLEAVLTSSLQGSEDYFGAELEASDGRVVVGNRKVNGPGFAALFTSSMFFSSSYTSSAYHTSSFYTASVYGEWTEFRTFVKNTDVGDLDLNSPFTSLEVPTTLDGFGRKVSIDGDNMAICCYNDRSFIISSVTHSLGAAYFYNYGYDKDCHSYDFAFRNKTYGDRSFATNNNFARSVSLRGAKAAIGYSADQTQYSASLVGGNLLFEHLTYAGSSSSDVNEVLGRVSIYELDLKNIYWSMLNTIKRNKEVSLPSYAFGYSVSITDVVSGSTFLAVGAPVFVSASNVTTYDYIVASGSYYPNTASVSIVSGSISGSIYVHNLDHYESNPKIGNVFYKNGELTITHPGRDYQGIMVNTGSTGFTLHYQGTQTIFEHEYLVSVSPGDFNFSTNPTALFNQKALFDVNQDGIFDFKDVDLILRFLNKQRYYTIIDEDDNAIVLNRDTLKDESWWNADILQTETEDVLLLEALFVANQTTSTDLSGGVLTEEIYNYIKTNLADTMILDVDGDGSLDTRDGAFILDYWLGTLTDKRILELVDNSSTRIYFKDIKKYIETYTGILNGFIINPQFHEYLSSSSYDPTGSYLAPVITSIGLYDQSNQLAAIGKLGRPIKNLLDWPINIIVRFDT